MKHNTGTSQEVLEYYQRNWKEILRCYEVGEDDLPRDAAFYRRQIYLKILYETNADNILDIGCGGGRTVLDALEMGRKVQGIEPIEPLVKEAKTLLAESGQNPGLIRQADMAEVQNWKPHTFGTVAMLSVLPHVDPNKWDFTHQYVRSLLVKGGYFIASYRNDLFDLFTFNSFTIDFILNTLWNCRTLQRFHAKESVEGLKKLIKNPDIPGPFYTDAKDKSFGKLTRVNSNPLGMPSYLYRFGLRVLKTYFYNYHCAPPLLRENIDDYRILSHRMDMEMSEDWRGHFMASTFVICATREE